MAHSTGQVISTLRKEKGWTQAELAGKLGVTDKAVSKWETDGGMPDTQQFPKIAELFGVTTDYLHTGIVKEGEKTVDLPTPPINPSAQQTEEDMDQVIQLCTQNGILCIDKLMETRNYPLIKRAFEFGYIHPFEVEYEKKVVFPKKLFTEQNWRELFQYCVDMGYARMAWAIAQREDYPTSFDSAVQDHEKGIRCDTCVNDEHIRNCRNIWPCHSWYPHNPLSAQERMTALSKCRQQILEDIARKWDKETTIGGLSKEYFEAELEKGNVEIVIIKLCKRLEAILKSDYHYDGDLNEMMEEYFREYGQEDDPWGEYVVDCEFVPILRKLKKHQESIIGSEKSNEMMTDNEIQYCINYICKMG